MTEIIARALAAIWLMTRLDYDKSQSWIFPGAVMADQGAPAYTMMVEVKIIDNRHAAKFPALEIMERTR